MSAKSEVPAAVLDATTLMIDVEMQQTVFHFVGGTQTTVTAPIDAWRRIDGSLTIIYRGVITSIELAHVTHSETRTITTKVRKDKAS